MEDNVVRLPEEELVSSRSVQSFFGQVVVKTGQHIIEEAIHGLTLLLGALGRTSMFKCRNNGVVIRASEGLLCHDYMWVSVACAVHSNSNANATHRFTNVNDH
jgi:hypothetical protein